ncbi:bifunctional UDP-sugar hydrolase/5'-nucleotidase UshA [Pseudoalteromonas sp. T1lg88]|uniref:bifunctional UDP-sugar hydrolase/5'-nucleotidase UshA n=1 Tax=Pseudoalteromonas sp. T1lg88 TaxID=2077104 RepID=UPI000CF655F6|nr:bifunctional UDP-sugar hydrolase/5'-nucleotidase UshA [Pseudoalteromonas sp. T1lg88]
MRLLFLVSAVFLGACTQSSNMDVAPDAPAQTQYLTVLHTNDHHGRFWPNAQGEYGMAARATLLTQLRAQAQERNDAVILLSGGDINTGIPESDLQQAEPDFKAMSMLGYDAMAIGNHEFDNPLPVLAKQQKWANFPLLSANILNKDDGKHAYQPYVMLNKQGLKIAVLGLTTTDTAKIANPDFIGAFDFIDPTKATNAILADLQRQQADVIIAVTHMGHYTNAGHGINAPGDVTLARRLAPGAIDMIVGGHSQEPVCMHDTNVAVADYRPGMACQPDKQNGIWIMQAHEWGKYVGEARFAIEGEQVTLLNYQLHPVNLKDKQEQWVGNYIEPDQNMVNFLAPYQAKGQSKLSVTLGSTQVRLEGDRNKVRFMPTNLAQVITEAQKQHVKADFAVISGGGIRDSIVAGEINYKDILRVHPFKNRIGYIDFSGQDALAYIRKIAAYPADSGAYAHFNNVTAICDGATLKSVRINGEPIKADKTYRMSINSYNAAGGDGYPRLNNDPRFVDSGDADASVLSAYVQQHSPLDTIEVPAAFTCR